MSKKFRGRCAINLRRWLSYAAAGAATAVAASSDADGAIFYSGTLNFSVNPAASNGRFTMRTLTNSRSGAFGALKIGRMSHHVRVFSNHEAQYSARAFPAIASEAARIAGTLNGASPYAYKLASGAGINALHFNSEQHNITPNEMATFDGTTGGGPFSPSHPGTEIGRREWSANGTGFIGFEFNTGASEQYGWERVTMSQGYKHEMEVIDYAYGTPGEVITAGEEAVPEPASLGLLAIGAAGLLAFRNGRKRSRKTAAI